MKNSKCPACNYEFQIHEETKLHELINCPICNSLLELVNQFPPTLDWADDPLIFSSRRIFYKSL